MLTSLVSHTTQAAPLVAYVGPGAGLSMLGALIAVICVILLALLGPILYPIKLFLAWRRKPQQTQTVSNTDQVVTLRNGHTA